MKKKKGKKTQDDKKSVTLYRFLEEKDTNKHYATG